MLFKSRKSNSVPAQSWHLDQPWKTDRAPSWSCITQKLSLDRFHGSPAGIPVRLEAQSQVILIFCKLVNREPCSEDSKLRLLAQLWPWSCRPEIFVSPNPEDRLYCERQHLLLSLDSFAACWVSCLNLCFIRSLLDSSCSSETF